VLADYLAGAYDTLLSPTVATELAADMDRIASGEQERRPVLRSFWARFGSTLRPIAASHAAGEHKPIVLRPAEEV
jgi:DNA topoisomerase IA